MNDSLNTKTAMTENLEMPDSREVANYPADPKAVMVSARGVLRVVVRRYFWDKEKKRGCEKREYLGYVVDKCFYSNDDYRRLFDRNGRRRTLPLFEEKEGVKATQTSAPVETRLAAELPLYRAVAEDLGLVEDLSRVWGEDWARSVLSLALHRLHTEENDADLYPSWAQGKVLPQSRLQTRDDIRGLYETLGQNPSSKEAFFRARLSRLADDEKLIAVDASDAARKALAVSYAPFGCGKDEGFQPRGGLVVYVGKDSHRPVAFAYLPGHIEDASLVPETLFDFPVPVESDRIFAAILTRLDPEADRLAPFADAQFPIIAPAPLEAPWVRQAVDAALPHLRKNAARIAGENCWGWTVPVRHAASDGTERPLWVHVYRSDAKAHAETSAFYRDLEAFEKAWTEANRSESARSRDARFLLQSPWMRFFHVQGSACGVLTQNNDAIDAAVRSFGLFCRVSTVPCSAREALTALRAVPLIERAFAGGRLRPKITDTQGKDSQARIGRFLVAFVAVTIAVEIDARMRRGNWGGTAGCREEVPLFDTMSWEEIKNRLSRPRISSDGKGKEHWIDVPDDAHAVAARLGFPDLYRKLPD